MQDGFHQTDGVFTQPNEHHFDDLRGNSLPVGNFNFSDLDSIEDRFKEALAIPGGVAELIRELSADAANERAADAVARVICLLADAKDVKMAVAALALASGLNSDDGAGGTDLAAKFGCTKQNISQHALAYQKLLGLKPARGQRSLAAREAMSKSYRERHGVKPSPRTTAK